MSTAKKWKITLIFQLGSASEYAETTFDPNNFKQDDGK